MIGDVIGDGLSDKPEQNNYDFHYTDRSEMRSHSHPSARAMRLRRYRISGVE